MQNVLFDLIYWLKKTVKEKNCEGVVYGLSGGVDSAVIGVLSKICFNDKALAIMMPIHSDEEDEIDARLVIDKFNLNYIKVDLSSTYDEIKKNLQKSKNKMAYANIKPRLRMTTLYYYAQMHKYLVLGSSNKSEFLLGYFTKYGDSGSDIMPLVDFTKKEIYDLAKMLEIPDRIIQKPPSAGLFEGQTDEKEMGFSYDDLEKYLNKEKIDDKLKEKIENMIKNSEHKRCFAEGFYRR